MKYLITDIKFDCSLDDDDWTPKDPGDRRVYLHPISERRGMQAMMKIC